MIEWNEKLSVGIYAIDDQHKRIIDMINSFYNGINQNSPKDKMLDLLNGMKEYTKTHFLTEERLMKQHNYPEYEQHKTEHTKFIEAVNSFEERYKSGKLLLTLHVTNFLKEWISNHIMGTDKRYTSFFADRGVN